MSLTDLPNELLIEIIKDVVPYNDHEPIIGVNAAWSSLSTYHQSLKFPKLEAPPKILDSLAQHVMVSIYEDLLSLRSTCSTLNAVCVPFVFKNLDILRNLDMPFEEFYDLIVKPYALYAKTVRIQLSDSVTDEAAARILSVTTNVTDLLLYHESFRPPAQSLDLERAIFGADTDTDTDTNDGDNDNSTNANDVTGAAGNEDTDAELAKPTKNQLFAENKSSVNVDWMHNTTAAIVHLLENHSLRCLGIYTTSITERRPRWGSRDDSKGPLSLLLQILTNPKAFTPLIMLDIALYNLPEKTYDLLRQNLPSLTSLTIHRTFDESLPRFWDTNSDQHLKWNMSKNLNRLSFRICTNAYAPHIPHVVRHIPSLKHLLVSVCGRFDDKIVEGPPYGWYSSEDALWKIRPPLDTFQIEHTNYWEIEAMALIPVKNIIFANTKGGRLIRALSADVNYFPKLEIISVESPDIRSGKDIPDQFLGTEFKDLEEICQRRGVSIVRNAVPTSLDPLDS